MAKACLGSGYAVLDLFGVGDVELNRRDAFGRKCHKVLKRFDGTSGCGDFITAANGFLGDSATETAGCTCDEPCFHLLILHIAEVVPLPATHQRYGLDLDLVEIT